MKQFKVVFILVLLGVLGYYVFTRTDSNEVENPAPKATGKLVTIKTCFLQTSPMILFTDGMSKLMKSLFF